jgi:hypothetical protein
MLLVSPTASMTTNTMRFDTAFLEIGPDSVGVVGFIG